MKLSSLSFEELKKQISAAGILLRTGSYVSRIKSSIPSVVEGISMMYADYPVEVGGGFADFHICLKPPLNHRRFLRRQVQFYVDGLTPFKPLAYDQAFPLLEWGLNWCISTRINNRLLIHAAVIEKNGFALIMPGEPGSGKSTLCAALVSRGWRLLSDELTMVDLETGDIVPLPRPVSLKNESIDVVRRFYPDAVISRVSHDTVKGTVAHMRAPGAQIERAAEKARPGWIVFPKFDKTSFLSLEPLSKGQATIHLIDNSFNYSILSAQGFTTITKLVDSCACYNFKYSELDEAIECFDQLAVARNLESSLKHD